MDNDLLKSTNLNEDTDALVRSTLVPELSADDQLFQHAKVPKEESDMPESFRPYVMKCDTATMTRMVSLVQASTNTDQQDSDDGYLSGEASNDEDGHVKIFKKVGNESDDELHPQFTGRHKHKKVTMLTAALKGKLLKIQMYQAKVTYI